MRTTSSEVLKCFFCDSTENDLHKVLEFQLERKVQQCATILEDNTLSGNLSVGDMIAKHAMYYSKCILVLYRRWKQRSCVPDDDENDLEKQVHGQVLENSKMDSLHIENLKEFQDSNNNCYLLFDDDVRTVLKMFNEKSYDDEAFVLYEAAKLYTEIFH